MAAYITVGAKTTHGGTVISGSPHTTHNGIPVSRIGDKVICKKCKKVTTILSGDASFIIDGAPIARGGDVTSCGAKLIAIQQSFAESDFDVGSITQAAPLQFAKSEPESMFASLADNKSDSEDDQYESNIVVTDQDGNPIPEDQRQDWIAGSRGGSDSDLTKPVYSEKLNGNRRPGYGDHGKFFGKPTSRPYDPGRAWDDEKLKRNTTVYGEKSATGTQTIEGLNNSGGLASYRSEQEQAVKNRTQNIATRTAQKLDVKNTPPPSLNNEFGYENPMAKVRDGWKGEAIDGIKKSTGALVGAGSEISPIVQTGSNIYKDVASGEYREAANKGAGAVVDEVKETAIESAKDYGASKSKVLDRANDIYGDYSKAQDMKSQAEEAAEWKRNQNR